MPKIIYSCIYCDALFFEEESAVKHEELHKPLVKIKEALYSSASCFTKYPTVLNCEMADGQVVRYEIKR